MCARVFWILLLLAAPVLPGAPSVAVIEDAPWSPGDAPRDGAAEMDVLLRLAQLRRVDAPVGLVGVGDRRGAFQEGTQRGLEFAVHHGVPVVRLARDSRSRPTASSSLFIDGGQLSPEAAATLLAECLERYGPLPGTDDRAATSGPSQSPPSLQRKLALYQAAFTARQPATVAMR